MSDTFVNYDRKCKDTQGTIKRVYLLPFVEYDEIEIQSDGMSLTVFPASTVYQLDVIGNYSQNTTFEKGNIQWTHTVEMQLIKVYGVLDVHTFLRNDFRVIAETNNGHLIMFGTNNGMTCTVSNSSGTSKPEFNGFTLTFEGIEEKAGLLITLLTDFFTVYIEPTNVKYGFLYNYYVTTDARKLSSSDSWTIPTRVQIKALADYLGAAGNYSTNSVGNILKEAGTTYWNSDTGTTNAKEFNGRGSGSRSSTTGAFASLKVEGRFGTSDVVSTSWYVWRLSTYNAYFDEVLHGQKTGTSIILVSDATGISDGETTTYIGNDGKAYISTAINELYYTPYLCETKYRDGSYITGYNAGVYTPISNASWAVLSTEAMSAYEDDETNVIIT